LAFFNVFAWIVLLLLTGAAIGIVAFLGLWPGKVAKARNHPQAEAIAIGSWLTLLLGFVLWPLVVIWAYMKPARGDVSEDRLAALEQRLARLELPAHARDGEDST
jgi:hypothetical protein